MTQLPIWSECLNNKSEVFEENDGSYFGYSNDLQISICFGKRPFEYFWSKHRRIKCVSSS